MTRQGLLALAIVVICVAVAQGAIVSAALRSAHTRCQERDTISVWVTFNTKYDSTYATGEKRRALQETAQELLHPKSKQRRLNSQRFDRSFEFLWHY